MLHAALLLLMLEAVQTDLVSPSAWSAAPKIFSYPQQRRPITPSIGPKLTSLIAPHMSALGGKADLTVCGNPLLRSLLGVKRTCLFASHMSAFDPKRTFQP